MWVGFLGSAKGRQTNQAHDKSKQKSSAEWTPLSIRLADLSRRPATSRHPELQLLHGASRPPKVCTIFSVNLETKNQVPSFLTSTIDLEIATRASVRSRGATYGRGPGLLVSAYVSMANIPLPITCQFLQRLAQ